MNIFDAFANLLAALKAHSELLEAIERRRQEARKR